MKLLIASLLTLSLAGVASASDYGMGVSIQDGDPSIYLPINVTDNFRIEPVFSYYKSTRKSADIEQEFKGLDILLGFFGRKNISENVSTYYGGRFGYTSRENNFEANFNSNKTETDGYIIEPAFGFEYHFTENISLGGEVSYRYSNVDGDSSSQALLGSITESKADTTTSSTNTSVVLRYVF